MFYFGAPCGPLPRDPTLLPMTLIWYPIRATLYPCQRWYLRSDADFILLVEKEAAYMRMAEDRFYQKYPCIVITAKGQPVRRGGTEESTGEIKFLV